MEIDHDKLIDVLDLHCIYANKVKNQNPDENMAVAEEVLMTSEMFLSRLTGIPINRLQFFTRFILADESISQGTRGTELLFLILAAQIQCKKGKI